MEQFGAMKNNRPTLLAWTKRLNYAKRFGVARAIRMAAWRAGLVVLGRVRDSDSVALKSGVRLFLVPGDKGLSRELKAFGRHEPLSTAIFLKQLKRGESVVDVGSNIGYYTLQEAKIVGPDGKVLAIEPNPICFKYLERNVRLNQLDNIELEQIAIWDSETSIWFEVSPWLNVSKVLSDGSEGGGDRIQVMTTTLDKLLSGWNRVDWLRFDIEGGEFQLINGAIETIRRFSPNIFMELHSTYLGLEKTATLLRKLESLEYAIENAILRDLDYPLVANETDVKILDIDGLLKEISASFLKKKYGITDIYLLFLKRK